MYAMNGKKRQKLNRGKRLSKAKECAYLAVFVALVIAAQLMFSMVPGVEVVTVLFIAYAFVFGWGRGMIAATAFSLLRQIIFGFSPNVLVLYLLYFNLLTLLFGFLGKIIKRPTKFLPLLIVIACLCTASFTLMDNILTPMWYGYSERARQAYIYASTSVVISQMISTAISVGVLFLPIRYAFGFIKKKGFVTSLG